VITSANWFFDRKWMPFFRAGWSDGEAPLMNKTLTAGIGRLFAEESDVLGVGVNWGDPSDPSLSDQYTLEAFFKLQVAENLAVTPSFQLLIDPALNPDEDRIWIFGFRARITL
jgi:porin